ncbi:hypothetical protein ACTQ56_11455 [[Clostridium] aminophilum]|uniref:hypothetical protein n=1 Tax=[Clostridium] aminophilum TaxID=1526 RepID=UPI003F956E34
MISFKVYRDGEEIGTVENKEDGSGNPVESRMFTGDPAYKNKTEYNDKLRIDSYKKLSTRKEGLLPEDLLPRYDDTGRQYHYTVSETAVKLTDVKDLYHLDYSNTRMREPMKRS